MKSFRSVLVFILCFFPSIFGKSDTIMWSTPNDLTPCRPGSLRIIHSDVQDLDFLKDHLFPGRSLITPAYIFTIPPFWIKYTTMVIYNILESGYDKLLYTILGIYISAICILVGYYFRKNKYLLKLLILNHHHIIL